MVCLLTTVVVCLLVIAGNVTCVDDFDLTCPDPWTNGTVETLVCTIPTNKLSSPIPCAAYIDTVEFRIITGSSDARACTVANINTACNNNNILADTCGCQSNNGTHITIVYKINAVRNLHENTRWACRPQCFDLSGNPAIEARNTSACFKTMFKTPQADKKTKDNCEDDCIGGSVSGGIGGTMMIVGGVVAVFWLKKIKVYVGYPREQITRIDLYAKHLHTYKKDLETELRKKMNCCVRCDVSIDGNRAIQADGSPKEDTDHLHVLVKLSKITSYNKMQDISLAVRNFLVKNVREKHVRTVVVLEDTKIPDMAPIAEETKTRIFPMRSTSSGDTQRILTISEMPEYEGDEGEEKRLRAKEQKPQYVIQIEGAEGAAVDNAEKKVKSLLWNKTLDRTFDVPNTPPIEELARQYVEEMTGTTIIQTIEQDGCSIRIQGSNNKYIETAEKKVLQFLEGIVQMVLVPENSPITDEALYKIGQETGTTICKPLDNGKEQLVIHIKGQNKENAVNAADKVKALFAPSSPCCMARQPAAPRPEIV